MNWIIILIFGVLCSRHVTRGETANLYEDQVEFLERLLQEIKQHDQSRPTADVEKKNNGDKERIKSDGLVIMKKTTTLVQQLHSLSCTSGFQPTTPLDYGDGTTTCGERCCPNADTRNKRIVGGNPTQRHEFPWHAAIYVRSNENGTFEYTCGGVLVHGDVVLTAAHCLLELIPDINNPGQWNCLSENQRKKIEVYLGLKNLSEKNANDPYTVISVNSKISPGFAIGDITAYSKDVALLQLQTNNGRIPNPVCLYRDDLASAVFNDAYRHNASLNCFAIGHGSSSSNATSSNKSISDVLLKTNIHFQNFNNCNVGVPKHHRMMCATSMRAGNRSFACFGDSGSPVVCPITPDNPCSPYYVVGIIVGTTYDSPNVTCRGSLARIVDFQEGNWWHPWPKSWLKAYAPLPLPCV